METTIHRSGFLHFFGIWGESTSLRVRRALERMNAMRCREILVEQGQVVARVVKHPDFKSGEALFRLLTPKERDEIGAMDQRLGALPDDTVALGLSCYGKKSL